MTYDIANPDPTGTILALRSLGYSVEAAIADLVDNSVSAKAHNIDVIFTWNGRASWVAVIDDGEGMSADALVTAMTVAARGPLTERDTADLGRFGMGLKSASFSQAAKLTVASTTSRTDAADPYRTVRTWDLPLVADLGEWRLLHGADPDTEQIIDRIANDRGRGTIVVWRDLHRFCADGLTAEDVTAQKQFYAETARVEAHLGMVFARFLTGRGRIRITVNGNPVAPWDPFLGDHASVQRLPSEHVPLGGHTVRVEAFILPHPRKMTREQQDAAAGPKGWLDQQGFYVYRRNRLILAGDWLGIKGFRRDERYNLARIAVDVPAEADADWGIDVRKSAAVPPVGVRRHLQRIGAAARGRAADTLSHRGRIAARQHTAEYTYAWRVDRHDGHLRVRINRDHPLVREVLRGDAETSRDIRAVMRLLEETVPVAALRIMHDSDTADDPEPFRDTAPSEVVEVARRVYAAFVAQGRTPTEAKQRLSLMPPFDEFDGFWRGT